MPWAIVFSYLAGNGGVAQIPAFVWALLVIYALFFNTFPINMYLQYQQWHWWSEGAGGCARAPRRERARALVLRGW